MKSKSPQQSLFEGQEQPNLFDPIDQNRVESMVKFWIERHKIYLRKSTGRAKPWTKDQFLQTYRFCNIYRELDTVSKWVRDHVIKPYEDHEDLWFMLAVCRMINWPETLQEMMDQGVWPEERWNSDKVYRVLNARKARGVKIITGAYIVNTVFPKHFPKKEGSKVEYLSYIGFTPMWKDREQIRDGFHSTMEDSVMTFRQYHGWGSTFMPYQVTVDLTYSNRWLGKSPDLNTYVSPGPGTQRGLHRILNGHPKPTNRVSDQGDLLRTLLHEVNSEARRVLPKNAWTGSYETGFVDLTMSNLHNLCCEYDKYCRLISGTGEPRSRYPGR